MEKKTIYETLRTVPYYKKKHVRHTGQYGIEIETESFTRYPVPYDMTFWGIDDNEGSLRNFGIEYVLNMPLDLGEPMNCALDEFKLRTEGVDFIQESISSSIHVHVNMLNETWITMANFIVLYTLFENVLVNYCGPTRYSNLFCLPIRDAEGTLDNILTFIDNATKYKYKYMSMSNDHVKYASLNLASFGQFGSLEVRCFKGVTDINVIKAWLNIIDDMLNYARKEDLTPRVIVNEYLDIGPEDYLRRVFKNTYIGLESHTKDVAGDIERNLAYIAIISSSVSEWGPEWALKDTEKYSQEKIQGLLETFCQNEWNKSFEECGNDMQIMATAVIEERLMEQEEASIDKWKKHEAILLLDNTYIGATTTSVVIDEVTTLSDIQELLD